MSAGKEIDIRYSLDAAKSLLKIDKAISRRITAKINENACECPHPLDRAKQLTGVLTGVYRYRIGDYCALFDFDGNGVVMILEILRIEHRSEVYRI